MALATRSPKVGSVLTQIHQRKKGKGTQLFASCVFVVVQNSCDPWTSSLCISPSTCRQCRSCPGSTGSFPSHMLMSQSNCSSRCYEEQELIQTQQRGPDHTKATATTRLAVSCVLPAMTDDLMSLFSDSFLILNHPTKVPRGPERAQTWLTFTLYEKSGMAVIIFFLLIFLFLNLKCSKLEPYSNHGCLKLNRTLLSGFTSTLTVGKSRKPGEGEIGGQATAAGTLLQHNTAADGCHQQILTFLLSQRHSGVGECDSVIRSRFGLILSNDSHHSQHAIVRGINAEGNVGLKGRWIYPHVFSLAAGNKWQRFVSFSFNKHFITNVECSQPQAG